MRIAGKYFLLISILFSSSTKLVAQIITSNANNVQVGSSLSVGLTGLSIYFEQGSPTLTSIDPDNAQQGDSLAVTITGQNTAFLQGSGTMGVWFSEFFQGSPTIFFQGSPTIGSIINATSYSASSNTLLSADFDIPADARLGLWHVNVWDGLYGVLSLFNGFTITGPEPPILSSIDPDNAQQGDSLAVTITGQNTNFLQGSGTMDVWFSQGSSTISASSFSALSDTSLYADFAIPGDAPLGLWNVNVWTWIDGILTLFDGFTITEPPLPDLIGEFGRVNLRAPVTPGDTIRAQIIVANIGTAATARKQVIDIDVFLRPCDAIAEDILVTTLDNLSVSNLQPGRSRRFIARIVLPGVLDAGEYQLVAEVDSPSPGSVAEWIEVNNTAITECFVIVGEY